MDNRRTLHLANTFFEEELSLKAPFSFKTIKKNLVYAQLQFLPLLYAEPVDGIVVTDIPENVSGNFYLLDGSIPKGTELETWGASEAVSRWAEKHHLRYDVPPVEVVQRVNSKAFSYQEGKKLPNSALLYTTAEVESWIHSFSGPKVLKACFGVAGRGNLRIGDEIDKQTLHRFLEKEWQAKRPIVGEPWVKRMIDFSTQWVIEKNKGIVFVGATLCENDEQGRHVGNCVGNISIPFLDEHKEFVHPVLAKMANIGFFGHVGIDAMVYEIHKPTLHPIVEINARKTMGWVALKMLEKKPGTTFSLRYDRCEKGGLLPTHLGPLRFPRNAFTINR